MSKDEYSGIEITVCPNCGNWSLAWDSQLLLYRCHKCKRVFTKQDFNKSEEITPERPPSVSAARKVPGPADERPSYSPSNSKQISSSQNTPKRGGRLILSLAVFSILIFIALGIAWYLTNNNLEQALQKIEQQTAIIGAQETRLAELSEDLEEARIEVNNVKIELEATKNTLSSTQQTLSSTQQTLSSTQQTLILTQSELSAVEEELQLYKDTWGSVVTSELRPPFLSYNDVQLYNNSEAVDVTWRELKEFIINDETDKKPYVIGSYVCGEFAKDVHNNAEKQGIKAAWVAIKLEDGSYHALNAFKTNDRGLVFIDCTGIPEGEIGPPNRDKVVDVSLGNQYIPKSLLPQYGWEVSWGIGGRVLDIQIYW